MHTQNKNNEDGFGLALELIVVAVVLSAIGFGAYQYSHHTKEAASVQVEPPAIKAASDVNSSLEKSASLDVQESTDADELTGELNNIDTASEDLEGGVNESSF